jgi:hypothetical protein
MQHARAACTRMPPTARYSRSPPVALDASSSGGKGIDFISVLPTELMRRILRGLPGRQLAQIALVSNAWCAASLDDALWVGPDIHHHPPCRTLDPRLLS